MYQKNVLNHIIIDCFDGASFTLIILKSSESLEIPVLATLLKFLKPSGRIVVSPQSNDQLLENLKLTGFVNVAIEGNGNIRKL